MEIKRVGSGKVVLISGGGKIYTDIAARFCRSQKDLDSIIGSEYNKNIVKNILESGHLAATEFDWFIFGIEGYSRVTETQLVRKRMASYLIKSGRTETNGKRKFDIVLPEESDVWKNARGHTLIREENFFPSYNERVHPAAAAIKMDYKQILELIESWYEDAVSLGMKEEEARYIKPQATEFKAIIGMNAHSLIDWFKIRCCNRAQTEIRDLATKMLKLCKEAAPDLFVNAGSSCIGLGYCPEKEQCDQCKGTIPTHNDVLKLIKRNRKDHIIKLENAGLDHAAYIDDHLNIIDDTDH